MCQVDAVSNFQKDSRRRIFIGRSSMSNTWFSSCSGWINQKLAAQINDSLKDISRASLSCFITAGIEQVLLLGVISNLKCGRLTTSCLSCVLLCLVLFSLLSLPAVEWVILQLSQYCMFPLYSTLISNNIWPFVFHCLQHYEDDSIIPPEIILQYSVQIKTSQNRSTAVFRRN